jgi:hypothetical protein
VWFSRFENEHALQAASAKLDGSSRWAALKTALDRRLAKPVERLTLQPTARSSLR